MNDEGIKPVERFEYDGRSYGTIEQARYAKQSDAILDYMEAHPFYVSQKGQVKSQEIMLWLKMSCPRLFVTLLPEEEPDA